MVRQARHVYYIVKKHGLIGAKQSRANEELLCKRQRRREREKIHKKRSRESERERKEDNSTLSPYIFVRCPGSKDVWR